MDNLNTIQVANILGINVSTLKRWSDAGKIDCEKTAGGHRKFTVQNVRDYFQKYGSISTTLESSFPESSNSANLRMVDNREYKNLAEKIANCSMDNNFDEVISIISTLFMVGIPTVDIFDYVIDTANIIVEKSLEDGEITHLEAFSSRKLITQAVETLFWRSNKAQNNEKTALCVNFENNLPDVGVVMSGIILSENGYNVFNTGSHAKIGNFSKLIKKKNIDTLLFYLCNLTCCKSIAPENLEITENHIKELVSEADRLGLRIIFGGEGLRLMPKVKDIIQHKFLVFNDLIKII